MGPVNLPVRKREAPVRRRLGRQNAKGSKLCTAGVPGFHKTVVIFFAISRAFSRQELELATKTHKRRKKPEQRNRSTVGRATPCAPLRDLAASERGLNHEWHGWHGY